MSSLFCGQSDIGYRGHNDKANECQVHQCESTNLTVSTAMDNIECLMSLYIVSTTLLPCSTYYELQIWQASKHIWKVLQVILSLWAFIQIWWNIASRICFLRNLSPGLLRWCSLQTKKSQMRSDFVSPSSKIVECLRRRKYDQVIIERTMDLVLDPSTSLYWSFLKHCTLTNKAVGTIWRYLSKPPKRRQGPDPRPLWLLSGLLQSLDLSSLPDGRSEAYSGGCLYISLIYCLYHLIYACNNFNRLSAFVGCWSSVFIRRIINRCLNVCPFDYTVLWL